MAKEIEVASHLSPSEVIERLARYGKEWRESKIPPNLRTQFFGCRIVVSGQQFELELEPQGRGPYFIWRGKVDSDNLSGGSRILMRARMKRWYAIYTLTASVLFFAWWAAPQLFGSGSTVDGAYFAIVGTSMMLIIGLAINAGGAERQRQACDAILVQILGGPGNTRPVAT